MVVNECWASGTCSVCGGLLTVQGCRTCDGGGPSFFNEWQYTLELSQLCWDPVFYGFGVPRGDGAPILLVPGFLAGDLSMSMLGEWLRRVGYQVHYSGINCNTDCPDRMVQTMVGQIARIVERSGRRLIIIGHSKGGYLARVLALKWPHLIRHVIALGSPFNEPLDVHPFTLMLVELVKAVYRHRWAGRAGSHSAHYGPLCYSTGCQCDFALGLRQDLPEEVRYTAIYSRQDGVVRWRHCLGQVPDDNIEVFGTHLGLICNSQVYRQLGRVLADSIWREREAGRATGLLPRVD